MWSWHRQACYYIIRQSYYTMRTYCDLSQRLVSSFVLGITQRSVPQQETASGVGDSSKDAGYDDSNEQRFQ